MALCSLMREQLVIQSCSEFESLKCTFGNNEKCLSTKEDLRVS